MSSQRLLRPESATTGHHGVPRAALPRPRVTVTGRARGRYRIPVQTWQRQRSVAQPPPVLARDSSLSRRRLYAPRAAERVLTPRSTPTKYVPSPSPTAGQRPGPEMRPPPSRFPGLLLTLRRDRYGRHTPWRSHLLARSYEGRCRQHRQLRRHQHRVRWRWREW